MFEGTMKTELDPMMIQSEIIEMPIKGERTMTDEQLADQATKARKHTVAVDYHAVRGTCADERERIGLANGESTVEARPSAFAGPNIYGLVIAELSGYFGSQDLAAKERAKQITITLNDADLLSGAHENCKANESVSTLLSWIAAGPVGYREYAKMNMSDDYNDLAMTMVFNHAQIASDKGIYDNWTEADLPEVLNELGDDPGQAVERLADVPHKGRSLIRNKIDGTTVDQTALHNDGGEDSFVFDDAYADLIESAVTSGPNAVEANIVARHAREAFLAAVAGAVPNREINQINQVR